MGSREKAFAVKHFNSIIKNSKLTAKAKIKNFTEDNDGLTAVAKNKVPTMFLRLIGKKNFRYTVNAKIKTNQRDAEIVLVLDYSDSMITNSKYQRMQTAAADMIDNLSDNGTAQNIKIGIVPFAALVHLDLKNSEIRNDVTWNGCTQDRRAPANSTNDRPTGNNTKWGEITSTHPCTDMAASNLKTIPLSADILSVKNSLNAMTPYLWTHIALGAEFGWHLLSPDAPFTEAAPFDDSKTIKIFILLTDGMQTAPGWGPDGTQSVVHAEDNLQAICSGMKAQKIRVYTVGYDLYDTNTLNNLKNCAGAKGKFYDQKDVVNGLAAAFGEISMEIKSSLLRISE